MPLGGVVRESFIPEAVKNRIKYDKNDPDRPKLERGLEEENGGAGVYNIDLKKNYLLENDEWKHDKIPEIFNGQNVYDFIDPDIEAKLAELEEEEERLEGDSFYNILKLSDPEDVEEAEIRRKTKLIRNEVKMRKSLKNRALIPRSQEAKKLSAMESYFDSLGLDTEGLSARARSQSRGRSTARGRFALIEASRETAAVLAAAQSR